MPESPSSIPAKHVAAVVVGNALEFYDFYVYGYFAVYIGKAFFPSKDPWTSLLASLGTFAIGFVMRPIGGLLIGRMGDRAGRKPSMILSFWLIGIAMLGLAITPTYARIGIAAPMLLILFRMVQGFAVGGEFGPATAFLLEAAPVERRGFYGSFQIWSQAVSILAAGLVGFILVNFLSAQQVQEFGWRIAFLIGFATLPLALALRRSLPETFHALRETKEARTPLRPYLGAALAGFLLLVGVSVGHYVRAYMTTYAITTLHLPANVAFAATVVGGLVGVLICLLSGAMSDRIGRKPMILAPCAGLLVTVLPAFWLMTRYRSVGVFLGAVAFLTGLATLASPPVVVWLSESLPKPIRSAGLGFIYALSTSLFGGTTQYAIAWLIKTTGNPLMPAWYWTGAMVICLAAVLVARESAPSKLTAPSIASPELNQA